MELRHRSSVANITAYHIAQSALASHRDYLYMVSVSLANVPDESLCKG